MNKYDEPLLAIYRTNFYAFGLKLFELLEGDECIPNWHIKAMAHELERCAKGDETRLMISIGPRYLKSFCASIALPLWMLIRDPSAKIICVSYANGLAIDFSVKRRLLLEHPFMKQLAPKLKISKKKNTEKLISTTKGGGIYTTSIGGTLTGFGGDFIILDDPGKPADMMSEAERHTVHSFYKNTVYPRLDDKENGCIIIVAQRVHSDDLTGHILEANPDEWEHLRIPAIETETTIYQIGENEYYKRPKGEPLHAERESLENLENTRVSVGSYNFEAQYQQDPTPEGGTLFKEIWLQRYSNGSHAVTFDNVIDSWDTAAGTGPNNAYSCCTSWGIYKGRYYLLDCQRFKLEYPDLLHKVIQLTEVHNAQAVLVEHASSGVQLYQSLILKNLPIIPIKPKYDKLSRAHMATQALEGGKVFLPEKAAWLEAFEHEIFSFPGSKYTDQVDSMTQFLNYAKDAPYRYFGVRVILLNGGGNEVTYRDKYYERTGMGVFDNLFWTGH